MDSESFDSHEAHPGWIGPPAEVNMMGMGQTSQRTNGLHQRLRSRAFIVENPSTSKRVVYVTNNLCMTYGDVRQNVTAKLQTQFGNLYSYENVMISGEHTHSGPAGYSMSIFLCRDHEFLLLIPLFM